MYHDDPKIRDFFKTFWGQNQWGHVDILGCYVFDKETGLYHKLIIREGEGYVDFVNEVDYKDVEYYLKNYHPERYYARLLNV